MRSEIDIHKISYRLEAAESNIESHAKLFSDIQKEMIRTDEGLKGVREQAKAHNEAHVRSFSEVKKQMAEDRLSLESMIESSVRELQGSLDKLILALGIDEDSHAASALRSNLKTLSDMILARKDDIMWIKRGIITLVISGTGAIILLGLRAIFHG